VVKSDDLRGYRLKMPPARNNAMSWLWRGLLFLAALDAAVSGAWAAVRPADLFVLLRQAPSDDGLLLCRLLGFVYLTQAIFLLLAPFQRGGGGLMLAPLLGRSISSGVWLWLLGSGRYAAAGGALAALLAHDAIWPPLLAAILWTRRTKRRITPEASRATAPPAAPPAPPV
jgi:hypothetical protein